MIHFDANIKI